MSLREFPAPDRGEDVDPSPLPRPPLDPDELEVPPRLRRQATTPPPEATPTPPSPEPVPPARAATATFPAVATPESLAPEPQFERPSRPPAPTPVPAPAPPAAPAAAAPAPRGAPSGRPRRPSASQVEVRRVRRVLRKIDTWSLFRFVVLLNLCTLVVCMAAFVGVWLVASGAGAIPSIENFITQLFALKKFQFKAPQLFAATLAIGIIGVFVTTLITVVAGILYNLISDVVGGIEVTVLEEDPVRANLGSRRDVAE